MYELGKTEKVKELIAITKSDSGISGPRLAMAHIELGQLLAEQKEGFDPKDTTVVAMMSGGFFFAPLHRIRAARGEFATGDC